MRKLSFTIPGRLGSWQRARRDSRKGKAFSFTPDKMRADQGVIKHFAVLAMREQCKTPLVGPLRLVVQVVRTAPQSWSRRKVLETRWITSKPDFDNTLKLVADSLGRGVIFDDDAQIADGRCMKCYGARDFIEVTLEELAGWP